MIDYESELNEAQLRAVEFFEGPALVIAGAGSGKTRVLEYRVARLVEREVDPESILLLTFTRRASREMMKRASRILDERCSRVAGGTFHSFANHILRKYAKQIGFDPRFTILDREDSESLVNVVRSSLKYDVTRERFPKKRTVMNIISKSINTGRSVKDIMDYDCPHFAHFSEEIEHIQREYTTYKKNKNMMDYDDLLVHLRDLLQHHDRVRQTVSRRYRFIMVDEYQDTNKLQGHIAALLASEHANILVVGDDAQSIYSFRGADFRNIMDFPEIFPETEVITLEQNYRSLQPILDFTNRIIDNAEEKYSKELFTRREGDQKPVFVMASDEDAQAEFVCKTVLSLREDDVPLDEIAVLFRNSFHSNRLEVELNSRNIPYVKYGGFKFLEAAHIKDVMCFLKTVLNVDDEIGWRRLLPLIPGIGDVTASKIMNRVIEARDYAGLTHADFRGSKYEKDLGGLKHVYRNIDSSKTPVAEMIESFIPFYKPLFKNKYDNYNVRFQDINTLISMAGNYSSLENFLTQLTLEPPEKSVVEQADREEEKLVLSTIHSAKGLEWNTVMILSLLEGYLPDKRCLDEKEEIEEERRLFYVAATRAKERLYLIRPGSVHGGFSSYGNQGYTGILKSSRFLTEIEEIADMVEPREYQREDFGYQDYDDEYYDENSGGYSGEAVRRINRYYR